MFKKLLPFVVSALLLTACTNTPAPSPSPDPAPADPVPAPVPAPQPEANEVKLVFSSFDGGGPEYTVKIDDPEIVDVTSSRAYYNPDHDEMTGSGYDVIINFKGKKEGETTATVSARSPIAENFDEVYKVSVDSDLNVTLKLLEEPERPEGKYRLDYDGQKEYYENAKDYYAPGEKVEVYYDLIATDTDYSFYLDDEPVRFSYEESRGFVISFEMPDHDATLWLEMENSMEYIPENASIEAMFASELGSSIPGMRNVEMQADEDAVTVVFFTDRTVTDFKILVLQIEGRDDGTTEYKTTERENAGTFTREEPIAVDLSFYGDIPNNAVSYVDIDGTTKCFAVGISGMDGSLELFEI